MSSVAQSAVTTDTSNSNMEVLERRLLELRAQIDAILTQLASQKAAPAIEPANMPEPQGREATAEPAPAEAPLPAAANTETSVDMAAQAKTRPGPDLAGNEGDQLATVELLPSPESAIAAELPSSKAQASDDLTLIASIEADTHRHAADAPMAVNAALQLEMQVEPAGDAAALPRASAASAQPTSTEPIVAEPIPADAAERAAEVAASANGNPDVPAGAQVISFQPRHHKQKAGCATGTTTAVRPRRKLATKIAACIIALLAAATVLAMTDKAAVGSAESLPWMSPLPSYVPSGASWSFFGFRQGADQGSTTTDGSTSPARAVADDALLSRYREAWPTGW